MAMVSVVFEHWYFGMVPKRFVPVKKRQCSVVKTILLLFRQRRTKSDLNIMSMPTGAFIIDPRVGSYDDASS